MRELTHVNKQGAIMNPGIKMLNDLSDEYAVKYVELNLPFTDGYHMMSTSDLICREDLTEEQLAYLDDFYMRWDAACDVEYNYGK